MSTSIPSKPRSPEFSKSLLQADWLPLVVVLVIAIGLRVYQLGTESLWIDEMLSMRDAVKFTWSDPSVRPLYYFMLQQWMKIGGSDSDIWLRSLALLFDVVSVALLFQLGRYAVSRTVGTIAALMFALSPMLINHAQEVRMYSPGVCFCLAGTLALIYALEHIRPSLIIAWLVFRLLATITFPVNVLLIGADVLVLVWRFRDRRRLLIGFGIALVVMGLALLPALPMLLAAATVFGGGWSADLDSPGLFKIMVPLVDFSTIWPSYILAQHGIVLKAGYALYTLGLAALVGLALWDRKRATERLYWVAVWAIAPLIPLLIKSWVSSSLWVSRYILFTAPYFFILMAQAFVGLFKRQKWLGIGVAAIYGVAVMSGLGYYYHTVYRDDWKAAAAIVEAQGQPGDIVIQYADIPRAEWGFERYYKGDLPTYFGADLYDPNNDLQPEYVDTSELTEAELDSGDYTDISELTPDKVAAIVADWGWPEQVDSRLWFVCRDCGSSDKVEAQANQVLTAVIGDGYTIAQSDRVFDGVTFKMTLDVMLVEPEN